jgi:hypothetical protein
MRVNLSPEYVFPRTFPVDFALCTTQCITGKRRVLMELNRILIHRPVFVAGYRIQVLDETKPLFDP